MRKLLARLRCFLRGDHNHETREVTVCVDCGTVRRYPTREELGR